MAVRVQRHADGGVAEADLGRVWWPADGDEHPIRPALVVALRVAGRTRLEEGPHPQERRALGDWLFRQGYECQFVDHRRAVVTTEQVERAFSPKVRPLFAAVSAGLRASP